MSKLDDLAKLGQAIWLDYIRRSFITSGELESLIDQGPRGVTANPAILGNAIAASNNCDEALDRPSPQGRRRLRGTAFHLEPALQYLPAAAHAARARQG